MAKKINLLKSLNIEANEVRSVLLLITQSIFIGIFYGAFDIGAHTLFLKTYPEDMIPKAYIISGLIGITLTSIFSRYQSKIKFSKLAIRTFLFISVITILIRVFFEFTGANWTVFLVFILLGPLNILAILAFWGTVGRIFNLRQGKRLFGIIDSGQVFGIIISSFAIPLIITFLNGTKNLLVISAISIIFAMFIEAIISKKYKIDSDAQAEGENEKSEEDQIKTKQFVKDPYILFMALFVIFSMFAAFFVQYSFLVVTNEQYPIEEDLASYLGFFTGSMMAFTLIIKTFVYSKLMKTYGLKISLMLSSLLLALFTGIAIAIGFISGFEKASPGFLYFFLFISMGKLFNKTLKDALEVPAFKLLYQSLKKSIRFDVQAKIDGTINEIAALVSGILLYLLGAMAFIKLIHFSVVLFVLLIMWTLITIRLYKEYRNSLERALKQDVNDDLDIEHDNEIIRHFNPLINKQDKFIIRLDHIRDYVPSEYLKTLLTISEYYKPDKLNFLTKRHIIELLLLDVQQLLPSDWSTYLNDKYKSDELKNASLKELKNKLESNEISDINSVIKYLTLNNNNKNITLLAGLLRVPNINIQNISIRICGTISELNLINTLVEFIDSEYLFPSALTSLLQMGKGSVKYLIQMFYKTDITIITQLALIETIGKYKTPESISFLLDNISYHKKEIKEKSIYCLKNLEYQPTENELPKMFHPITEASQTVAWDISAMASLGASYAEHPLYKAINYEFINHQKELFDLLSITYDAKSVQHVQDYLDSGTSEGISYALELFDMFLSDEIKPMILTVFEDLQPSDKTKLFEEFFPVEVTSKQELLLNIINRDPNLICKETKRTALIEYTNLFSEITNDIIAQLFNPMLELQQAAAIIVNKLEPTKIPQLLPRIYSASNYNTEHLLNTKDIHTSLFNIDNSPFKSLFINNNDVSSLSEYFEISRTIDPVFINNNKEVNNYFVFLIGAKDNSDEKIVFNSYIDKNFEFDKIDLTNLEYFIGIQKSKMNKLVLINSKTIYDLINTIS